LQVGSGPTGCGYACLRSNNSQVRKHGQASKHGRQCRGHIMLTFCRA
jgi:hypothetical protein